MASDIAVIGSGYVGTVVASSLAHLGNQVTVVETNLEKLVELRSGRSPIYEPGLEELLKAGIVSSRLTFTSDLAQAIRQSSVTFICVGTPRGPDGRSDMSAMRDVAQGIGEALDAYHVVVTKSTVPVGTSGWVRSIIEDALKPESRSRDLFDMVSNPEFLREGNAVIDFLQPDRVVLGSEEERALDLLTEIYRPIIENRVPGYTRMAPDVPLLRTRLATAELAKYASNAFLTVKISFANEMARLCDFVGADVMEVTKAMGLDVRIGPHFLSAGIGWGGSCFGKDVASLMATAQDYGYRAHLLEASVAINEVQRSLVFDRLLSELKTLSGRRVLVLGLAFKPGTDDIRDSSALEVARRLVRGGAIVTAHDPMVSDLPEDDAIRLVGDPLALDQPIDAVVLATEWPEYKNLDLVALRRQCRGDIFFDGRNAMVPAQVAAAGFRYLGVGRPDEQASVGSLPAHSLPTVVARATGTVRATHLDVPA